MLPNRCTLRLGAPLLIALTLAGCGGGTQTTQRITGPDDPNHPGNQSIFGPDGLTLLGPRRRQSDEEASGIGVNSFLWRASLDTLSFLPVASADPFGGVIITDWYTAPETPNERVKVNLYILGRQLRADGIRAAVFRQVRDASGQWVDAPVAPETATGLEDAILTRARQLRVSQTASAG